MRYAQEDTHYLLYIYDRMRTELIDRGNEQKNLLRAVYQRSKELCLRASCRLLFFPFARSNRDCTCISVRSD